MWVGDTIYFTSDREGGKLNLYAYDLKSKQTRKVTNHTDYDVLWPSSDRKQIVYECGGYIWRFDPATGKDERIPIHVYGDFKGTVPYFRNVKNNIQSYTISPSGARALFEAHGDLFTVPAKHGEILNLTHTPASGSATRSGRRTASGSPTSATRMARSTSFTSGRPTAAARSASSPAAPNRGASRPSGRPTRPSWPGRTRITPCMSSTSPAARSATSIATSTETSNTTAGRRTAAGSPTPRTTRLASAPSTSIRCRRRSRTASPAA